MDTKEFEEKIEELFETEFKKHFGSVTEQITKYLDEFEKHTTPELCPYVKKARETIEEYRDTIEGFFSKKGGDEPDG